MRKNGTRTAVQFAVGMLLGILAMSLLAPTAQAADYINELPGYEGPGVAESPRESVDTTYEPPPYDFAEDGADAPEVFVEVETSGFDRASRVDRETTNQTVYAEVLVAETDTASLAVAGSVYREGKDYTSTYLGPQVGFTDGNGTEIYIALGFGGAWIADKYHLGVNPTVFLSTGDGDFVARIESERIRGVPGWYYRILTDGAVGGAGFRLGLHAESDIGVGPMFGLDLGDGPFRFEARVSHLFGAEHATLAAMIFFTYVPGT